MPDAPVVNSVTVFGPASVHLQLLNANLRGYESNTTYYVKSTGVAISSRNANFSLIKRDGLAPGSMAGLQVSMYVFCMSSFKVENSTGITYIHPSVS